MTKRKPFNLTTMFDDKYPPRGAWEVHRCGHSTDFDYNHGGYYSEKLKPCPACGRYPVFQEAAYDSGPRDIPVRVFIGFCPTCELRTKNPGTLKEAVMQWQDRRFSHDSFLVCHRPRAETLDTYGCRLLCNEVVDSAIESALFYAFQRQDVQEGSEIWTSYGKALTELEDFFRTSVFMFELDPDGVISDIRRALYPTLEPKDRIKIPLHLAQLYKGKEIVKRCTQKTNSSKQP